MKVYFKSLLILLTFLGVNDGLIAQDEDKKEELLDVISMETCDCINKKNIDFAEIERTKLELEFGFCVMESYAKRKNDAEKYLGVTLSDEASLEKLGEDIAFKMMNNCPDIILALAGQYVEDELEEIEESMTMIGDVVGLTSSQFNILSVKDKDNRTQKFLWLEYFEGEELLKDIAKLKKETVKVSFFNLELFDPKINEYRNFKVINSIIVL